MEGRGWFHNHSFRTALLVLRFQNNRIWGLHRKYFLLSPAMWGEILERPNRASPLPFLFIIIYFMSQLELPFPTCLPVPPFPLSWLSVPLAFSLEMWISTHLGIASCNCTETSYFQWAIRKTINFELSFVNSASNFRGIANRYFLHTDCYQPVVVL